LCTAVGIRLDDVGSRWRLTVCSAGHPLPLLRNRSGQITNVGQSNLILGVTDVAHYSESVTEVEPESEIVVFTDGVADRLAHGIVGDPDGVASSLRSVHGSADAIAGSLMASAYRTDDPRRDDMLLIAVRIAA
jgi:serine phosphatase RsbU (regulator of sigma subunit)